MTDTFDRMIIAAREQLRSAAEREVDPQATLRQVVEGQARVHPSTNGGGGGSRGRWMLAIAAALVLVVGGLFVLRRPNDSESTTIGSTVAPTAPPSIATTPTTVTATTPVPTSQPVAPSTSASTVPTTTIPATPVLSQQVQDMTFIDAQRGWALVGADSTTLHATTDGGTTWTQVPVDASGAQHVVFADPLNGWIYADDGRFQSTHDGGATWHDVDLTSGGMRPGAQALATDGTTVSIVAGVDAPNQNVNWTVATSAVGQDAFNRVGIEFQQGAGPANDFELVSANGKSWVVYNDRTVVDAARGSGGVWTKWTAPWSDLGGGVRLEMAPDGGPLYALVNAGEWTGGEVEYQLYRSTDNGDTFERVTMPSGVSTTAPPQQILAPDAATLVVSVGFGDGSTVVYRSGDAGTTWTQLSTFDSEGPVQLHFVDANVAYATQLSSDGSGSHVTKSVDGGATWAPVLIVAPT